MFAVASFGKPFEQVFFSWWFLLCPVQQSLYSRWSQRRLIQQPKNERLSGVTGSRSSRVMFLSSRMGWGDVHIKQNDMTNKNNCWSSWSLFHRRCWSTCRCSRRVTLGPTSMHTPWTWCWMHSKMMRQWPTPRRSCTLFLRRWWRCILRVWQGEFCQMMLCLKKVYCCLLLFTYIEPAL